jgi:DNA-binding response OmpR family regulator
MPKILVVDDESHVRKLYGEILSRDGYEVITTGAGEEAVRLVGDEVFDLIILDIELADENGLGILHRIKSETPGLPVILNSAYSVYKSDFHTWMADAYLVKSPDIELLRSKIREIIGK